MIEDEKTENAWIEPEAVELSEREKRERSEHEAQWRAQQAMADNIAAVARKRMLDSLAAMAMQGFCAGLPPELEASPTGIAKVSYDIAEAMLAESERRK